MTDTPTAPVVRTSDPLAAEAPATAKRNVLSTMQIVNLYHWCERNRDSLAVTPNPKLAAIAQAELEFPVTAANLANMLDELHIQKRKPEAPLPLEEQVMRLAAAWRTLEERVSWLESSAREREQRAGPLADQTHPELGLPVPAFGEPK